MESRPFSAVVAQTALADQMVVCLRTCKSVRGQHNMRYYDTHHPIHTSTFMACWLDDLRPSIRKMNHPLIQLLMIVGLRIVIWGEGEKEIECVCVCVCVCVCMCASVSD
jgi:hypothetical protein